MKVSKAQAQANRAHIVETATTLFKQRGYEGVGIAELMAAAGFTHGGFYKHFGSKIDLMAEAAHCGLTASNHASRDRDPLDLLGDYLSRSHRDNPGGGCTMAALCADAARQPDSVKAAFAAGIERRLSALAETAQASDEPASPQTRAQRIALMAQAIGAVVMSRSCPDDSALADEILEACRVEVMRRLADKKRG